MGRFTGVIVLMFFAQAGAHGQGIASNDESATQVSGTAGAREMASAIPPPGPVRIADPVAVVEPNPGAATVNGRQYVRPTAKEQFKDYLKDSYGWPALARNVARASFAQYRAKPESWGQDWPGFGQRFGNAAATNAIDGNVRYGLEMLLREDMRYIPCHGCSTRRKLTNALLAEITARHDRDGHRFFTLTPTIADMTGPILANAYWIPNKTAIDGFRGSRLTFATRIAGHLFTEFVLEKRHNDPLLPD